MKGHIFILLEEFLIETAGINNYENLLDQCQFPTEAGFIRTGNYPDEHLNELVDHAVTLLGITVPEAHYSFGRWLFPHLAQLVPANMLNHKHPSAFLKTVDYIHRVELKKLYPDAEPPGFSYQQINSRQGILTYSSKRSLFDLVEGVLQGVADYFYTKLSVERKPKDTESAICEFLISYEEEIPDHA